MTVGLSSVGKDLQILFWGQQIDKMYRHGIGLYLLLLTSIICAWHLKTLSLCIYYRSL